MADTYHASEARVTANDAVPQTQSGNAPKAGAPSNNPRLAGGVL